MARAFTSSVLVLLLAGACAHMVTWRRCADTRGRALEGRDEEATVLNLDSCNIETFRLGDFNASLLPKLQEIWLLHNDIGHVEPAVFSAVADVLTDLVLSHNRLRRVPACRGAPPLPHLAWLALSHNLIRAINGTLAGCDQLKGLNLAYNQIEYLHPDIFKQTKLETVYLSHNKIASIPETMFQIGSLKELDLSYNRIEHVPARAFRGCALASLDLASNRITRLPARFVSGGLVAVGAGTQYLSFFDNPWECGCLLEHLADLKRSGVRYHEYWYDGTEAGCVFRGGSACRAGAPAPLPCSPL